MEKTYTDEQIDYSDYMMKKLKSSGVVLKAKEGLQLRINGRNFEILDLVNGSVKFQCGADRLDALKEAWEKFSE